MAKLKWTVEFTVDECWVADGFIMTAERALDMLANDLGYATPDELGAKVVKAPKPEQIANLQGYPTVAACLGHEFKLGRNGIILDKHAE